MLCVAAGDGGLRPVPIAPIGCELSSAGPSLLSNRGLSPGRAPASVHSAPFSAADGAAGLRQPYRTFVSGAAGRLALSSPGVLPNTLPPPAATAAPATMRSEGGEASCAVLT